jgi:PAS domain S-box-containing protein
MLNGNVATLLADDGGDYIAVNDAACTLTGYDRPQLTGIRMGGLAADAHSRAIYTHLTYGRKLQGQKQIRRQDGNVVRCRYWAIPTQVARGQYFVLLLWPRTSSSTPRP